MRKEYSAADGGPIPIRDIEVMRMYISVNV